MLITNIININITYRNLKYFKKIGYSVKCGDNLEIPINHLSKRSEFIVKVKCDICEEEKEITYRAYCRNISNYGYYTCSQKCAYDKNKLTKLKKYGDENYNNLEKNRETCLEKYQVEYYFQTNEIKEQYNEFCLLNYNVKNHNQSLIIKNKKIETNLNNLGVENPSQSDIIKKLKVNNYFSKHGFMPPIRTELNKYRDKISYLTNKNKRILLGNWDGCDFYDNEYIKDNFSLKSNNKNYPTIDHKISVFYGFINNISPEEISKIDNLCFTKRTLNSKKHKKCYEGKEKN